MSLDEDFDNLKLNSNYSEHSDIRLLDKHEHKIKTDEISISRGKTTKDKANRATVENVLDPRTMRFLKGLMNRGVISDFNGCLSTGKEANVYHAFAGLEDGMEKNERREYAIKIYKTSILIFKDRERYVDGEFRFRNSRSQHNPRKMIKIWAEKEFRNLRRIYQSGVVPGPEPIEVRNNVLVMEFLSRGNGYASPKLRDYQYKDRDDIYHYYYRMISYIRLLYQVCRLVHADLSEYNAIVHDDELYIIDVSQSVEPEHPMSLDFLRMDIKNINMYFEKLGIDIFSERLIFQFVISEHLENFEGDYKNPDDLSSYIAEKLPIKSGSRDNEEDEVFRSLYLVRNLGGLEERDFDRFTDGKFDLLKSLIAHDNEKNYKDSENLKTIDDQDSDFEDISEDEDDEDTENNDDDNIESESEDESGLSSEEYEDDLKKPKGKKYENKDEKKQRKQDAKEAKREKRKVKVKKHIKKKLVKKSKSKK